MNSKVNEILLKEYDITIIGELPSDTVITREMTSYLVSLSSKSTGLELGIESHSAIESNQRAMKFLRGTLHVKKNDDMYIQAREIATVIVCNRSRVDFYDNSNGKLFDSSVGEFYDNSRGELFNNSVGEFYENAIAKLYDNSRAQLYNDTIGELYDKSIAELYHNSRAKLSTFSYVRVCNNEVEIEIPENFFGVVYKPIFTLDRDIIVYKKLDDDRIATLMLFKGQEFQAQSLSKCRTNKALVLKITNIKETEHFSKGYSIWSDTFEYKVGETVEAEYDTEFNECASGIHFFMTKEEAINY